ncbi:GNAT family N-acetyltransferase [Rhodobacter sp. Har01]|uniref:GNAT family N-acetyltransferase n=1 Tax=Rhodobacter sp. Har01 TaxID=2883999 RepID=UPI001D075ED9|nr:GNAT family N-acetyltransferase [Rhodobacter sp. Har01]MCB6176670.1 GNAT family N-acetyltransferase [Rhodobacter sp. Har01]
MNVLRPARPSDLGFLEDLEREVMEEHAVSLWGRFLPSEPSAFDLCNTRIYEIGGLAAGYLVVEPGADHLRLRKLYLVPDWQGRGHGRRLLALARSQAGAAGLALRLSVLRSNSRALAFYQREGMQPLFETAERIFLEYPAPANVA